MHKQRETETKRNIPDLFTCRSHKNAWLGETKDRKIGFFKRELVEEVFDENVDGRCTNINRIAFDT